MRGISGAVIVAMPHLPAGADAQSQPGFGAEEFGLTQRQLVQSIRNKLQDYELAARTFKFQDELLGPVEEQIQQLFSRKVQ